LPHAGYRANLADASSPESRVPSPESRVPSPESMQYTTLGATGLTVSRICLGCMSYGNPGWRPWVLSDADARPFFKGAIELGINFFDTADMYSLGVSEEVTGRALRDL